MRTEESAPSERRRGGLPPWLALLLYLSAFGLVGYGLGCYVHPGVGCSAVGLLLWVDLFSWSRAP